MCDARDLDKCKKMAMQFAIQYCGPTASPSLSPSLTAANCGSDPVTHAMMGIMIVARKAQKWEVVAVMGKP
jgi:hypothetical protein